MLLGNCFNFVQELVLVASQFKTVRSNRVQTLVASLLFLKNKECMRGVVVKSDNACLFDFVLLRELLI